jgi:hypothetical protein
VLLSPACGDGVGRARGDRKGGIDSTAGTDSRRRQWILDMGSLVGKSEHTRFGSSGEKSRNSPRNRAVTPPGSAETYLCVDEA